NALDAAELRGSLRGADQVAGVQVHLREEAVAGAALDEAEAGLVEVGEQDFGQRLADGGVRVADDPAIDDRGRGPAVVAVVGVLRRRRGGTESPKPAGRERREGELAGGAGSGGECPRGAAAASCVGTRHERKRFSFWKP